MKKTVLPFFLLWVPFAACSFLALAPSHHADVGPSGDVWKHAVAFTYLTLALDGVYFRQRSFWIPVVILSAYGLGIEIVQIFLPTRYFQPSDMLVDILGICLGIVIGRCFIHPRLR